MEWLGIAILAFLVGSWWNRQRILAQQEAERRTQASLDQYQEAKAQVAKRFMESHEEFRQKWGWMVPTREQLETRRRKHEAEWQAAKDRGDQKEADWHWRILVDLNKRLDDL